MECTDPDESKRSAALKARMEQERGDGARGECASPRGEGWAQGTGDLSHRIRTRRHEGKQMVFYLESFVVKFYLEAPVGMPEGTSATHEAVRGRIQIYFSTGILTAAREETLGEAPPQRAKSEKGRKVLVCEFFFARQTMASKEAVVCALSVV